jgi:hypothetical protein
MMHKFLEEVDSSLTFKTAYGSELSSMTDLAAALELHGAGLFNHHVAHNRNDFANWVEHVIGDGELSSQLRSASDHGEAVYMVNRRIAHLKHMSELHSHLVVPKLVDLANLVVFNKGKDAAMAGSNQDNRKKDSEVMTNVSSQNTNSSPSQIMSIESPEDYKVLLNQLERQVSDFEKMLNKGFEKNPFLSDQVIKLSEKIFSKFSFSLPI